MDVVDWLLDSDPAIRWQVMRDLAVTPEGDVAAERARVATEGWGARLLALQRQDGHWDKSTPARLTSPEAINWWESLPPERQGTLFPEWTSTAWSLMLLRAFGLDPAGAEARQAVRRIREHVAWEHGGEPFFAGEVEPCINGKVVALGAYFGEHVDGIVDRLLGEQMSDGGWNCEQENGSTRGSFHSTIDVLDGLLEYERATGGSPAVSAARLRGQEYLLERRMLRRLSTGDVIDPAFTQFSYPTYWHYDVLRGLDYMRAAGAAPDERMADAIQLVESKRDSEGRWSLENPHPGHMHFAMDEGEGRPSRWNTLRAMRVLRWYEQTPRSASSESGRGSCESEDTALENSLGSPSKQDPRQRVAVPLFRAIGPLMRLALRRGLPAGPNALLTVRGRVTGRPYSTPVAMWEFGDRRFVQASFGVVGWVRNLRASRDAVIRRGRWSLAMRAIELSPVEAGQLMNDALAGFRRPRLLRILLGPTVRPPAAILHRYRLRVDDHLEDYVAEARRHPLFELVPRGPETRSSQRD